MESSLEEDTSPSMNEAIYQLTCMAKVGSDRKAWNLSIVYYLTALFHLICNFFMSTSKDYGCLDSFNPEPLLYECCCHQYRIVKVCCRLELRSELSWILCNL